MDEPATKLVHPPHPYYPLGVEIIGYVANSWHFLAILGTFGAAVAAVCLATTVIVTKARPGIAGRELATVLWFVQSGCIHLFFEGYYVYNFRKIASLDHFLAQMWKEYAHSDSRYLTQDPFVLCMETITVVMWGPLCIIVAILIVREHPLRYPLQAVVSLGQMYADVLYYCTSLMDHYMLDISYSRPEPFYFWFYFVFTNAFWIVIPAILIYSSIRNSVKAFQALTMVEDRMAIDGVDGDAKKLR